MIKMIKWKITSSGKKRQFRVTTADGKEYLTFRSEYLYSEYQWGGEYLMTVRSISSVDLLDTGIKYGILVADAISVQPIKVEEISNEDIILTKELEKYYLFFKPKKPDVIIPPWMKCEEVK